MIKRYSLAVFILLTAALFAAAPTTGQFLFQRKTAGPFDQYSVTPVTGQAFGWNGSAVVMLATSGSGVAAQLPSWAYSAGGSSSPANGTFTADNADPFSTSTINVSDVAPGGATGWTSVFAQMVNGLVVFTSSTGESIVYRVTVANASALTVQIFLTSSSSWSGAYYISFIPANVLGVDTGWTANSGAGDKTAVVANFTSADVAGADTINAAFVQTMSNQIETLTKKVQALETALTAKLLPNN